MQFEMRRVRYMPKELRPGILYVSEEFDIAMHLCACGCGSKIKTPLGVTEWSAEDTKTGPTLAIDRQLATGMPIPLLDNPWRGRLGGKVDARRDCGRPSSRTRSPRSLLCRALR